MDTYITKIEDINDDMMATVKDNAVEEIKSSYSYSSNKLSNIEYAGAYLVYTKEDYKANTYNELYAVIRQPLHSMTKILNRQPSIFRLRWDR